jgi:hypothetical protein
MKRIFFKSIFTLSILITLGSVSVNAFWCRRDPQETSTVENFRKTVSQPVSSSDFVFSGTLIEENPKQLIFKIENSWKGGAKDKTIFRSLHNVTDNGEIEYFIDSRAFQFELGKSYLVYGNTTLRGLEVSACGRTTLLTNAQRDIEELNRQKQIEKIVEQSPTSILFRDY